MNTLRIVNYVPRRLLTLQAAESKKTSYGVGYQDTPAHQKMLQFFIPANEALYPNLKKMLEGRAEDMGRG